MNNKLKLTDSIKFDKNNKKLVSDLVGIKGEIFKLIKEGYQFDDEVLEKARIKKTIRNERVITGFVNTQKKENKVYAKDTESVKNILKSLNTLENPSNEIEDYTPLTEISLTEEE